MNSLRPIIGISFPLDLKSDILLEVGLQVRQEKCAYPSYKFEHILMYSNQNKKVKRTSPEW